MRFIFLIGAIVGITGDIFAQQAATIPFRYGSAYEREDTGVVDLSSFFYAIDRNGEIIPAGDIALHFSDISLPYGRVNSLSGITLNGMLDSTVFLQTCSFSLPLASSVARIGMGYNPCRIRRYEEALPTSPPNPDKPGYKKTSITMYNEDRLTVSADGIVDFSSLRHLFFGTELNVAPQRGYQFDYIQYAEDHYYSVNYKEMTKENTGIAITAGIGYWRDFQRNSRKLKFIGLLEGFYSSKYQPLQPNSDIVDWLSENMESDPVNRYSIFTTGYTRQRGGARLIFSLSDRILPNLPMFNTGIEEKMRKWLFSIEKIGFTTQYMVAVNDGYSHHTYTDTSVSYRNSNYTLAPYAYGDHRFKLHRTLPFSTSWLNSYLFGRITYWSRSTGSIDGEMRRAQWNSALHLWFGTGILLFERVILEVSYLPFNAYFFARYNSRSGKSLDKNIEVFRGTGCAFDVRLLR